MRNGQNMKISIIVPNYNNEKYISQCLDSLVNQTYKDLEIVVIDDGSTDASYEIIKDFARKDPRIVVQKQANQGPSAARNRGLEIATGDLFGFVDGDDYCRLDMFEILADALIRNEADISICSRVWSKDGATKPREYLFNNIESIIEMDKGRKYTGYMWTKLYRRELFDGIRFNIKIKAYEDLLINHYLMYKARRVVFHDEELYYYRQNPDSFLRKRTYNEADLTVLDATEEIAAFYRKNMPEHIQYANDILFYGYYHVISRITECGAAKQYKEVIKNCLKGYRRLYTKDNAEGFSQMKKRALRIGYPLFCLLYKMECLKSKISN